MISQVRIFVGLCVFRLNKVLYVVLHNVVPKISNNLQYVDITRANSYTIPVTMRQASQNS